jgi:outer membrane protein assembly factor BamD (BamD/ComL family)
MRGKLIVVVVFATQGISACASLPFRGSADGNVASAWQTTLPVARAYASDGRFDAADSVLADFAARFPGTQNALETAYWRALFKMDPTNAHVSMAMASSALDAYLANNGPRDHVAEATVLRRIAGQLDALSRLAASAMTQAKDASSVAANAKAQVADANARADAKPETPASDAEIKRLKDELAKANAELDRIRKRLSIPPGKPQ